MLLKTALFLGQSTGWDHLRIGAIAEFIQQRDYALLCASDVECLTNREEVVIYCDERWLQVLQELPITPQVDLSLVPISAAKVREWGKQGRELGCPDEYYSKSIREEFGLNETLILASELTSYPAGSVELVCKGTRLFLPDFPFLSANKEGVQTLEETIESRYEACFDSSDLFALVSYAKPYSDKDRAPGGVWAKKQSMSLDVVREILEEKSIDYPEGITPICVGYAREENDGLLDPPVDFANGSFQTQIDFLVAMENVCNRRGKGLLLITNPSTIVWTSLLTCNLEHKILLVGESEFQEVAKAQRCFARRLSFLK